MELYRKVRLACRDGMSERAAARHFGVSRQSVRKMLQFSVPPGYRRTAPVRRPKLDEFTGLIEQWLEDDRRHGYQVRARYGVRWALSNDAEAASVNTALELRAEVLTGNSGLSVDTDVPATVCPAYDDPGTPEDEAGSFIVNVGFSTRPAIMLYYEPVSHAGDGEVESTLTGVYPWGRYEVSERLSVWGVAGYGAGTLTLTPKDATPFETDMDLAMAAVGGRSVVVEPPADGGLELAVKSDALVVRTTSEEVHGSGGRLEASDAGVTRVRLGLEGTWLGIGTQGGGSFAPSLEVGVRHDGGDAETGFGADIGAGVAWTDPSRGLKAVLAVRGLLTHEEGSFRERGFAGSLSWDPAPSSERGPSLTLSQTVGAQASGGMDALFRPETGLVPGTANDDGDELRQRRLEAKLGYGLAVFEGRYTGTPELGLGLSGARREVILGWRLSEPRNAGLVFGLAVEGARSESAGGEGEPEHRIGVKLTARW